METACKGLSLVMGRVLTIEINDGMNYLQFEIESPESKMIGISTFCSFEGTLQYITDRGYDKALTQKNTGSFGLIPILTA